MWAESVAPFTTLCDVRYFALDDQHELTANSPPHIHNFQQGVLAIINDSFLFSVERLGVVVVCRNNEEGKKNNNKYVSLFLLRNVSLQSLFISFRSS